VRELSRLGIIGFCVVSILTGGAATLRATTAVSTIALVQRNGRDAGSTSSVALAFPSANVAGHWIGVCVRAGALNETITVTDSQGNTYRKAFQSNQTGDGDTFALYYAENIKAGANAVQVAVSSSTTLRLAILEYSGVATSGSLDVTATAQGSSSSVSTGSVTTTASGDLLLGVIMTGSSANFIAGSGYNIEQGVPGKPNTKLVSEDQVQASAGSVSVSASLGAADQWGAGLAAFKAALNSSSGLGTGGSSSVTATPASITFSNVPVGTTNSQTIQLTNGTGSSATFSASSVQAAGFAALGLTTPMTIAAGASSTFNVSYTPSSTGTVAGMLTLTGSGSASSVTIPLVGSGVTATGVLAANPPSVSFGNVAVGSSSTINVSLSNTGNSSLAVNSLATSGTGFSSSGLSKGISIGAGQTVVLAVAFAPNAAGSDTGTIAITSSATSGGSLTIPLTGSGSSSTHAVNLNWVASTASGVVGYNVYRSTVSGGPYTKIVSSPVTGTSNSDSTVQSGTTYYYVVTSVGQNGAESGYSNETMAVIP